MNQDRRSTDERLDSVERKLIIALRAMVLAFALFIVATVIAAVQFGNTADDIAASQDDIVAQQAQTKALAEQTAKVLERVQRFAIQLKAASVRGCKRQNAVRKALRKRIHADIRNLKHTDPNLFPNIPAEQFQALLDKRAKQLHAQLKLVPNANCDHVYPQNVAP